MSRHVLVCEESEKIFPVAFFQIEFPDAKTYAGPESRDANFVNQDALPATHQTRGWRFTSPANGLTCEFYHIQFRWVSSLSLLFTWRAWRFLRRGRLVSS